MDYFKILNLDKEPFSNSPEPDFFFPSTKHLGCLQQLELAIRLRRGMNVVMGEVGTGKTTLCRQLILRFSESEDDRTSVETHLLLDPSFSAPREFLSTVAASFGLPAGGDKTDWQIREGIKNYLFQRGVDESKTVVLIIDEGQKLPDFCLEILREFLNYETNEFKLLQIVIFAQNEFKQTLKEHENFADRVNQYYYLGPLNFKETRTMIEFRLARAGRDASPFLFTFPAMWAIYRATGGYPRKIVTLCHQILLSLIIQNRMKAGWMMVRSTAGRLMPEMATRQRWAVPVRVLAVLIVAGAGLMLLMPGAWNIPKPDFLGKMAFYKAATPESPRAAPEAVPEKMPAATETSTAKKAENAKTATVPATEKPATAGAATAPPPPEQRQTTAATIAVTKPESARTAAPVPMPAKPVTARVETAAAVPEKPPVAAPAAPVGKPAAVSVGKPPAAVMATATPAPKKPAAERPLPAQSPPQSLGSLHIRRGGTILRLLREVYGSTETVRFTAVVRANPHIEDPNWVLAGETIHFPAIKGSADLMAPDKIWVRIAQKKSLNEAYRFFKDYPDDQFAVRLVPAWNPRDGLIFSIVLKESFDSPAAAGVALRGLPAPYAKGAEIMEKPGSETVYFAK